LYADTLITRGQCKALVCCVGARSSRGAISEKLDTDIDTRLQSKMKNLEGYFTLYSILAAALIFVLMTIMIVWDVIGRDKTSADAPGILNIVLSKLTNQINFIVVLIVVSIPEGLPLTIGVSLAFSVGKMYQDKLLVRKLDAPEKMGAIEEICCGKTGTITKGEMKVTQFHCE
jgi:magnesium-transporting ATPase (P-type)